MQTDCVILKTAAEIVVAHQVRSQTAENDLINEFAMAMSMDLDVSVSEVKKQLLEQIFLLKKEAVTRIGTPWSCPEKWDRGMYTIS